MKFLARGQGYNVFVARNATVLTMTKGAAVRMRLVGGNDEPVVEGLDATPTRSNYFIGRDPAAWHTGVPHYTRVRLRDVYPGIDEVLHAAGRQFEYDLVLRPRADASHVRVAFDGVDAMRVTDTGSLLLETAAGAIEQRAPTVYQVIDGIRRDVGSRYVVTGPREVGFEIAAYDRAHPLVIDPVIVYATYLGGSGTDTGYAVATGADGSAYITGGTASTDFPTADAVQPWGGGERGDAFVAKIDPSGTRLLYATYFGGSDGEAGRGIAVDANGSAYVAGATRSSDFPARNALQPTRGGDTDAFVLKLNAVGSDIVYSTFLGGSGIDDAVAIAVDANGRAHVTGETQSTNFPVSNAAQATKHGLSLVYDAFIASVDASGASLAYSTYLGGTSHEGGNGIAVDAAGNAYVAGQTSSMDFPTVNARQLAYGGGTRDGFVAKVAPGGALLYATYLGGNDDDTLTAIAVTSQGRAYVTGSTRSIDFPVVSAQKATNGEPTVFKSTDGGRSWRPLALSNVAASSIAIDRLHPSTVYVGGQRLFKSTDGGAQWTMINVGAPFGVGVVATDPLTSGTVYAGAALNNLLKSTDDGRTWTKLVVDTSPRAEIRALAFNPVDSHTLYAGSYSALARTHDGGATWTYSGTQKAAAIAVDPSNPSIVYAGRLGDGSDDERGGIFKSTDGGATWGTVNRGPIPPGPRNHEPNVIALVVDPRTTSTVYIVANGGVFKSATGGDDWTAVNTGLPQTVSGRQLAIDPMNPSVLYLATTSGIFKTADGGATWNAANNGLNNLSVTALAVSPSESGVVYAATAGATADALLASLSADGSSLVSSTYLGGGDNDAGTGVAVGARGIVYVTGTTSSGRFPTVDAIQPTPGGGPDGFVAAFDGGDTTLRYASYLGGSGDDHPCGIAVDAAGNVVITGGTSSTNFPLARPLQNAVRSLTDAFIVKMTLASSAAGTQREMTGMMPAVSAGASQRGATSGTFETRDGVRYQVDTVAADLDSPSALAFAPDGRLFVAERPGRLRVFDAALRSSSMALTLDDVFADGDAGLRGLALDPDFARTGLVYLYYTARTAAGAINQVVRYREVRGRLAERVVTLDGIPGSTVHNGGALRFGPDGLLYVATGDAGAPAQADDLGSLAGKILRINGDGTTPRGNPFASPVFSSGYHDPRGLDWSPVTRELWTDDAGRPSSGALAIASADMRTPVALMDGGIIPAGVSFNRTRRVAPFENDLFVATLSGQGLLRLHLDRSSPSRIVDHEWLDVGGGASNVIVGPDGLTYIVSSDSRTDSRFVAGALLRIVPR